MRLSIKQTLIERDEITPEEADELIADAKAELYACIDNGDLMAAEEVCYDWFGLEPDYLEELIF